MDYIKAMITIEYLGKPIELIGEMGKIRGFRCKSYKLTKSEQQAIKKWLRLEGFMDDLEDFD